MKYNIAFGLPALGLTVALYLGLEQLFGWPHYYFSWVIAASVVTFAFYGVDKGLSKAQRLKTRVPELILNLLTVFGGSFGAWLGRYIWHHKISLRKHWLMFVILMASTLLQAYVLQALYSQAIG